jgi:hypothetical protein
MKSAQPHAAGPRVPVIPPPAPLPDRPDLPPGVPERSAKFYATGNPTPQIILGDPLRARRGSAGQGVYPSMVHDMISSPQELPRVPGDPDHPDLPIAAAHPEALGDVRQGIARSSYDHERSPTRDCFTREDGRHAKLRERTHPPKWRRPRARSRIRPPKRQRYENCANEPTRQSGREPAGRGASLVVFDGVNPRRPGMPPGCRPA